MTKEEIIAQALDACNEKDANVKKILETVYDMGVDNRYLSALIDNRELFWGSRFKCIPHKDASPVQLKHFFDEMLCRLFNEFRDSAMFLTEHVTEEYAKHVLEEPTGRSHTAAIYKHLHSLISTFVKEHGYFEESDPYFQGETTYTLFTNPSFIWNRQYINNVKVVVDDGKEFIWISTSSERCKYMRKEYTDYFMFGYEDHEGMDDESMITLTQLLLGSFAMYKDPFWEQYDL